MKDKIDFEITYPQSPEVVWRALTDASALRDWLLPSDFRPLIGFRFRFERVGGAPIKGKVIEVLANRLLAYTWDDGEAPEPSVVCWSLEPVDGGTRVRLEHRYVETPEVNCLVRPAYFNWRYALRHSLPGFLALLAGGQARRPVFYGTVVAAKGGFHAESLSAAETQRRIGFREREVVLS